MAATAATGGLGARLRRRGPLAAFAAFGLFWGGWAALVPAVQGATGASRGALGLAFLFVAVGSLPGMLVTGRELDRHGPRLVPALLCAFALAILLPGFAGSPETLAVALLADGVGGRGRRSPRPRSSARAAARRRRRSAAPRSRP